MAPSVGQSVVNVPLFVGDSPTTYPNLLRRYIFRNSDILMAVFIPKPALLSAGLRLQEATRPKTRTYADQCNRLNLSA